MRGTFNDLIRQQLLIYARELVKHCQKERDLQYALSEREGQIRELAAAIRAQEEERHWSAEAKGHGCVYVFHDRGGRSRRASQSPLADPLIELRVLHC